MSDYQDITGTRIKYLSSDPTLESSYEGQIWYNSTTGVNKALVQVRAWASSGSLGTARYKIASAPGAPSTAGIVFSGQQTGSGSPNTTNLTEEYNGFAFSPGGNLGTSRRGANGFGTQTTAVCVGGFDGGPAELANVEEYNGSTWTEVNNTPNTRRLGAGCGTLTAGITFGGLSNAPNTFEYDGTNWTVGGNLNTGRNQLAAFGTQTAALGAGGYATSALVEEYNGTTWSEVNNIGTGRYGAGGGGLQTNGLIFGGHTGASSAKTETYDGTSFTESSDMATARQNLAGFGASQSSAVASGGNAPPGRQSATEEYNSNINAITKAAWASGGAIPDSKRDGGIGSVGTQTAGLAFGGEPVVAETYEYDGSSWTDTANMGTGRRSGASFGPQTAAGTAGGNASAGDAPTAVYETYDGSSWSEGPDLGTSRNNAAGQELQQLV